MALEVVKAWGRTPERVRVSIRQVEREEPRGNPPALVRVRQWGARASSDGAPVRAGYGETREAAVEQLRSRLAEVLKIRTPSP